MRPGRARRLALSFLASAVSAGAVPLLAVVAVRAPAGALSLDAVRTSSPGTPDATGDGLVARRTSAIGDSLMIDYETALEHDLPGVVVDAQVSRQFSTGIEVVEQLRAARRLGTKVVIDLGTNGTVTTTEFDQMLQALRGVSRVVFVTVHVDQPWQGEVNAVLRAGVAAHARQCRLADWAALAAKHPGWFYSDGTHLPFPGPGADALAALVAAAVKAR